MSAGVCQQWRHDIAALRPFLIKFARTRIRDESTVEDIVQDTLLAALAGQSQFMAASGLRTWLTAILHHKIIDSYRRNTAERARRVPHYDQPDDGVDREDELMSIPTPGIRQGLLDPSHDAERRQLAESMMAAVQQLPSRQRDIFVLVQMHGYSGAEVAKTVGLSDGNVWTILHRARKGLQSQLQGVYG